jgi:hypothetical protein
MDIIKKIEDSMGIEKKDPDGVAKRNVNNA